MAKLWYEPKAAGTQLQVWNDPQVLERASIESELAGFQLFRGLADEARQLLAQGGIPGAGIQGGWPDLISFDAYLDDEIDRMSDILDYFAYESRVENLTVRDGDWFLPEALENPLPDDDGTNVVANAIDAVGGGVPDPNDPLSSTYWESSTPGTRKLIVRVRGHKKKLVGIRLRTNNGDARSQLQNLTVRAAQNVGNIEDPGNVVATGVNLDDAAAWFEVSFVKHRARYIQLDCTTSNHTNPDVIRIRSLQVRVGITNHDK